MLRSHLLTQRQEFEQFSGDLEKLHGVVLLVGIVVNNAIILVDTANRLRREGACKLDALRRAGRTRLRPILMTTATTVLGLTPMAIGLGEGSEPRAPMALAVIGGLLSSRSGTPTDCWRIL